MLRIKFKVRQENSETKILKAEYFILKDLIISVYNQLTLTRKVRES